MKLTDQEKAILDGQEGKARQKALELLVKYGEALGAEDFVDTHNALGAVGSVTRPPYDNITADMAFARYFLDSEEEMTIPAVKAFSCHVVAGMDPDHWEVLGFKQSDYEAFKRGEQFCARIGIQLMNTCTPYLVGNVPVKGEHCAWMESSAVVYCNSVLGCRTNTEGAESSAAAMLVGKIPNWGFHRDENRLGTHLVKVEYNVESVMDWGLLGYYIGEIVGEEVPVIQGIKHTPNIGRLKHFGAAAASSGGIELYHILGITPDAPTLEAAFGGRKPRETLKFGKAERKIACDNLNSASDPNVDFVMLGCPHYTLEQLYEAAKLLDGKRISSNVSLWIFTPRALKAIADYEGLTAIIEKSGAVLMSDTCPCICRKAPKGARVAATDSGKQTHYIPAILGIPAYFGSQEDCIQAAVTGWWRGELK
jgi:predicted aconitase